MECWFCSGRGGERSRYDVVDGANHTKVPDLRHRSFTLHVVEWNGRQQHGLGDLERTYKYEI